MPESNNSQRKVEHFDDVLETAPLAIYEIDYQAPRFKRVNRAMCVLSGYTEEELLSMNPADLLDAESAQCFRDRIKLGLAGQRIDESVEFKLKAKDGHDIWAILRIKPTYKDGKLDSALVVGYDISERKKAEEALSRAKSQYELLFNSVTEGFANYKIVFDENGKIDLLVLDINPAGAEQSGVKREEQIGKTWRQVWQGIPEEVFDIYRGVYETGKSMSFEHFSPITQAWYIVTVSKSAKDQFAVTFFNITERKKVEEALRNTERLLSSVANGSSDAIYVKDRQSRWLFANPALEKIVGKPSAEVLGRTDAEIYGSNEASNAIMKNDRRIMSSGKPETVEESVLYPDGQHSFISVKAPRFDENGQVIGLVGISHDITERKKAEETLAFQAQLLTKVQDAIFGVDTNFIINYWNEAAEKIFGWTKQEALGRNSGELLKTKIEGSTRAQQIEKLWIDGKWAGEVYNLRKDGSYFIAEITVSVLKDERGKAFGIVNVVRDITERKKAEEKLEEYKNNLEKLVEERTFSLKVSEEKYRKLFDSIDEGFCIIEMVFDSDFKPLDYRFLEINASFERQTGMHDAKGKLMKSFAPNHEAYWFEIYGKVALTGQPIRFTNEAKTLNRFYDVYAFPVGEGKIRNVGVLFNDISQRRNLEIQLKDSERLAAIGATAGMVGHDIRNPLQAITSDVYLAKTDLASTLDCEEKKNAIESLDEIEKNVVYINKIVQDLQDFAKPLNPHAGEADLKLIIDRLLEKNGLPQNVKVEVKIEDEARKVVADSDYLNRILYNLVTNAVQAMPNGGKLSITANKEAKDIVIAVKDTGVGIPKEIQSKMFTPMFTTKSKGQGFGLPVVKRMTESLGGTVSFESQEGKGTIFTIRLTIKRK